MPRFELSKSVEGIKVSKRSGIPTTERVTIPFGAIVDDPREERDSLRFSYLGDIYDVKLPEIKGYIKEIGGGDDLPPAPKAEAPAGPKATPAPADTRFIKWESIPSNLTVNRAKVPGGWLVTAGHGMAFVPDAEHEWDGSSL